MSKSPLTEPQQRVLTLIAQGSTVSAAADAVGVHRNTIANWRRNGSPHFCHAWETAQYEQAAYWRDEMQALAPRAIITLRSIFDDPKASPSVRLRACLAVINKVATPARPEASRSQQSRSRLEDAMIEEALRIPAQRNRSEPSQDEENTTLSACAPFSGIAQPLCTTPAPAPEEIASEPLAAQTIPEPVSLETEEDEEPIDQDERELLYAGYPAYFREIAGFNPIKPEPTLETAAAPALP